MKLATDTPMKSLERRFEKIKAGQPNYTDYTCFAMAVKGQGFSRDRLFRWFKKLVPSTDYGYGEERQTMEYLWTINQNKSLNRTSYGGKTMLDALVLKLRGDVPSVENKVSKSQNFEDSIIGLSKLGEAPSVAVNVYEK